MDRRGQAQIGFPQPLIKRTQYRVHHDGCTKDIESVFFFSRSCQSGERESLVLYPLFICFSPVLHGLEDRTYGFARLGQRIFYPGRDLRLGGGEDLASLLAEDRQ